MKRIKKKNETGDRMRTELEVEQRMTLVHEYGIDNKRCVRLHKRERENGFKLDDQF
jgi:hypothetical protein